MWERRPTPGSARPRGTDALAAPQSGKRALALRLGKRELRYVPFLVPDETVDVTAANVSRLAWTYGVVIRGPAGSPLARPGPASIRDFALGDPRSAPVDSSHIAPRRGANSSGNNSNDADTDASRARM